MELSFIPIDYDSLEINEKTYAKIIGRSEKGKRICLIDECDIYFWAILKNRVSEAKINQVSDKIAKLKEDKSKVIKVELHNKKFLGEKVKALKIFVNNYPAVKKIKEKIKYPEISSLKEHDINFITRYIIEKKLIPLTWHKIKAENIAENEFGGINSIESDFILKIEEIKTKEKLNSFAPKILSYDIESAKFEIGKGEILMISLVSENFRKVLTWKKCSKEMKYVECYKNEKEMLEAFVRYVKQISPDVLTGYFSDGFDLPYLKARADFHKIKLSLGLDNSNVKFSGGMMPRGRISGIVHVDLFKFIETAYSQYLQSETLGLGDVSNELLGETKHDYEFKHSSKMHDDDWAKFFDYNLQDSVLTYKLFEKTWQDMMEFSKVMQEPLFEVSRNGMASNVDSYIVHNLQDYNEIIEEKPEHSEIGKRRAKPRYEGAFVLEPKPALYENLAMFDFTSMYASVIVSYNLSKSSYRDKKEKNATEVDLGKNKKAYFSEQEAFFPLMLKKIILLRKKYKAEYKQNSSNLLRARSNAFKLLANAAYGYQGFFGARYYSYEAAASTAALARKAIHEVISRIEKAGYEVIYGDTDSICFLTDNKTKTEVLAFLKKLNENLPGIMELELEDFYKRGIWVTTRKGEIGAKKKYALIDEKGKLKIRGFETVRRDWCALARETQNKVLDKILNEGNEVSALKYIKEIIQKVKERKVDKKQLIIRTQLKKPLSEYKAITPHVVIAKKMMEKELPIDPGTLIEYYIAESSDKKALTRDRACLPDDKKPYDIDYYLNKQILPAVENILQVFGISIEEVIKGSSQKKLF